MGLNAAKMKVLQIIYDDAFDILNQMRTRLYLGM